MDDEQVPKKTVDCVGLYCPQPLFQTREGMDAIEIGEILEVLADDPAAEEDIKRFAKRTGHEIVKFEKQRDIIRFLLRRTK
ncbi:MAG: sulfurtransferase TusA family protein [candidate division WOR-3 bacterium]|nr:MAG: sulfurtransferase TusA family protein [candidate division WOR-3 bacterium]